MTYYQQNSIVEPITQTVKSNNVVVVESPTNGIRRQTTVALIPWCDVFEDFFDSLGVSIETYCQELTGGWQFNYIEAMKLQGVNTVIFFFSTRVSQTTRYIHQPTNTPICVLPATKAYRMYHQLQQPAKRFWKEIKSDSADIPTIATVDATTGDSAKANIRSLLKPLKDFAQTFSSYICTPLGLLAEEIRREGCDVIITQEYETPRFDMCVLLGKLMKIPVFSTFQGGSKPNIPWEYPFRRMALNASAGLIVAPQAERQRLQTSYGVSPAKIAPIFNPMDTKTWGAVDRNRSRLMLGIPKNARVVVYHGRIQIPTKGLDILLQAWQKICLERPDKDLRLLLVGTGNDAPQLHSLIADMQLKGILWIDEYVRDRSRIQQYLSAADVYTLASRKEGFPVAPIEAMACSLPVVAADASGISDIFPGGEADGGLVVPREDAKALASALLSIIDNPAWGRELGKRARIRADEAFGFDVIGKQLRDLFLIGLTHK
jgi:starch synthase